MCRREKNVANNYLLTQQPKSVIIIQLRSCFCPLNEWKSDIYSPFSSCLVSISWLLTLFVRCLVPGRYLHWVYQRFSEENSFLLELKLGLVRVVKRNRAVNVPPNQNNGLNTGLSNAIWVQMKVAKVPKDLLFVLFTYFLMRY